MSSFKTCAEADQFFLDTMRGTKNYKKAVEELYYWQTGGDSFSCMLFNLIAKADYWNKENIWRGFPYHILAFDDWQKSTDMGTELFKNHGLLK